mgnify:CR=1 FL=1
MNYLDYLRTDKFPHFWCVAAATALFCVPSPVPLRSWI